MSCSVPLQRETGDASKQNCVQALKKKGCSRQQGKQGNSFPPPSSSPLLSSPLLLHYPRAPCTAAALPDSHRGKCDAVRLATKKCAHCYLPHFAPLAAPTFLWSSPQRRPKPPALRFGTADPPDFSPGLPSLRPVLLSSLKAKAMGTLIITQCWQIFIQTHSLPAFVRRGSNT